MGARGSFTALLLLISGCAASPRDQVDQGDLLLQEGQYASAQRAYAPALREPGLSGLLLARAQIGEARCFLGLADLVTAESRLRRISDQVSGKWYYLGEIAVRRGEQEEARRHYTRAFDRGHSGDTARKLARVIAGEATSPEPWVAAAATLERGGEPTAAALREAQSVWRDLLAGADPHALVPRLKPAIENLTDYPAVHVLQARLLDLDGRTEEASAHWKLDGVSPPPSEAYRAHADSLRGRLAAQRGDHQTLLSVLKTSADPALAGHLAAQLADARTRRGDLAGAIELLQAASSRGGGAGQLALARAAQLEVLLGRAEGGADWELLPEAPSSPPELVARVALQAAWQGDLPGAAELVDGDLAGTQLERLRAGARLLGEAAGALGRGDESEASARALETLLLVPGDPAAQALAAAAAEASPLDRARGLQAAPCPPAGRKLLTETALRVLLRAGELEAARTLGVPPPPFLPGEVRPAILEASRRGRRDQVAGFLLWASLDPPTQAALNADSHLVGAEAPPQGRVSALPPGVHHGSAVTPSGLVLRDIRLERDLERGWSLIDARRGRVSDLEAEELRLFLGARLEDVRWFGGPEALPPGDAPFRLTGVLEAD